MSWFLPMLANASHLQTFDRICGSLGIDGSGEDRIVSCLAAVSQLENVHVDAYPYYYQINDMLHRLSTSFLPCVHTVNFQLFSCQCYNGFHGRAMYSGDDIAAIYPTLVRVLYARRVPQPGVLDILFCIWETGTSPDTRYPSAAGGSAERRHGFAPTFLGGVVTFNIVPTHSAIVTHPRVYVVSLLFLHALPLSKQLLCIFRTLFLLTNRRSSYANVNIILICPCFED
ncbi:hypothetical protein C8J57DRAFT_1281536 [Mycena rebaudengoi]|nr:hypothetical protein C8J57DRAFT_1281536 [Mycena rebaudengoi]